jgi:hypothetical protein
MVRRMRFGLMFSCAALAACGATTDPSAREVSGSPTAQVVDVASDPTVAGSATAVPRGAATATASARPPAPVIPAKPPLMKDEDYEILSPLCSLARYELSDTDVRFGCRTQPPFDQPREIPDGQVLEVKDAYDVCSIRAVHRGSFSTPGAQEAIVGFDLCKTDDGQFWNGSQPGFALLVEQVNGRWQYVSEELDLNAIDCDPAVQPSGLAVLVCEDNFGAYGDGAVRWLFSLDFSRPAGSRVKRFGSVYSNAFPLHCEEPLSAPFLEQGVTDVSFGKRAVSDADGDGIPDVSVAVERAHVAPSRALDKRLATMCRGQQNVETRGVLPKPKTQQLRYKGTANGFEPTPETQRTLDAWGRESSEFWIRLGDGTAN